MHSDIATADPETPPPQQTWFSKSFVGEEVAARARAILQDAATRLNPKPKNMAVFRQSNGPRCTFYFSPEAAELAKVLGATRCSKPKPNANTTIVVSDGTPWATHFPGFSPYHPRNVEPTPQLVEVVRAFSDANQSGQYRRVAFDRPDARTIRLSLVGKPEDYDLRNVWTVARSHGLALEFTWTKEEPPRRPLWRVVSSRFSRYWSRLAKRT